MNQRSSLIQAIKRELKAQGLTYKMIAAHLQLSENSIKRLFSEQNTSLQRLEQLCELAGLSLVELVKKMDATTRRVERLSLAQEEMIVSDTKLLLVSICVLHYWRFDDIVSHYAISEAECIQLLVQLDRLKLIELQPLNRIRLIVSPKFRWRDQGPVQNYFKQQVQQDFFQSDFQRPGEMLLFSSGMLSKADHQRLEQKMGQLIDEFNQLHQAGSELALDEKYGSSLVVALRAWEFSAFSALRRQPNQKVFT